MSEAETAGWGLFFRLPGRSLTRAWGQNVDGPARGPGAIPDQAATGALKS